MLKKIIFVLLIIMLGGCSKQNIPEGPDIGIPEEEVNARFKMEKADAPYYSIKNNDVLFLKVEVTTSDNIAFSVDYDARMFILEDDQWVEIENNADYPGDNGKYFIVLPYSPTVGQTYGNAFIVPYNPDLTESKILRIIFSGKKVQNGWITEDRTAAYLDLTLVP